MNTKRVFLCAAAFLLAIGCSKSEASKVEPTAAQAAPGTPAPAAATKPAAAADDWATVDKLVAAAKSSDDMDAVLGECLSTGMQMVFAKKITDIKTDAGYYQHCTIGPARAEARLAIKGSKPGKPGTMNSLCLAASMKSEEIAASGKPEAAEFKKLAKDVNKACGL
jgi:hypothetical protein